MSRSGRALGDRQRDREAGAAARDVAGVDPAAVRLDDRLDDPEPEPHAALERLLRRAHEALEDGAAGAGRKAGPGVLDPEHHLAVVRFGADPDLRSSGRELVGVGEQVDEHLREAGRVADQLGQPGRQIDHQSLRSLREQRTGELRRGVDHRLDRERRRAQGGLRRLRCERSRAGCRPAAAGAACRARATARAGRPRSVRASSRLSRSSSIDASCAESGVLNSCDTLARMVSRSRRAASTSVSSRSTCTWRPFTGGALVMTVVSIEPSRNRRRSVARLAPRERAWTIGQLSAHGRTPPAPCGSSTSPQNRPRAAWGSIWRSCAACGFR